MKKHYFCKYTQKNECCSSCLQKKLKIILNHCLDSIGVVLFQIHVSACAIEVFNSCLTGGGDIDEYIGKDVLGQPINIRIGVSEAVFAEQTHL